MHNSILFITIYILTINFQSTTMFENCSFLMLKKLWSCLQKHTQCVWVLSTLYTVCIKNTVTFYQFMIRFFSLLRSISDRLVCLKIFRTLYTKTKISVCLCITACLVHIPKFNLPFFAFCFEGTKNDRMTVQKKNQRWSTVNSTFQNSHSNRFHPNSSL